VRPSPAALHRLLASALAAELRASTPALYSDIGVAALKPTTRLRDGDLAMDSLTLMRAAIGVATFFNLYSVNRQERLLAGRTLGEWAAEIEHAWDAGADGLAFRTSGSTGVPKDIHHPFDYLAQEVDAWADLLREHAVARVVLACPAHHIYGAIWGVLLPQRLNVQAIDAAPAALAATLRPNDLLVTVPPVWDFLAPGSENLPRELIGTSSTAPLAPDTAQRIAPHADLWEIYGSSETAGVGHRVAPDTAFTLLPYWSKPRDGDALARRCPDGQARLYQMQDHLRWSGENRFTPAGRIDRAIQVGGHNVSAQWVAQEIRKLSSVTDCAVRVHGAGAQACLKAFIVLRDDTPVARHDTTWALREALPNHAVPRYVSYGERLPRNDMGKLVDWEN
jgi:long-chain acyl-CoA synthetase